MWWTAHSPARSRVSYLPIRSAVSAVISCSSGISAAYCCLDAAAGRSGCRLLCRLLCRLICLPSPVDFHINLLLEMQDGQGVCGPLHCYPMESALPRCQGCRCTQPQKPFLFFSAEGVSLRRFAVQSESRNFPRPWLVVCVLNSACSRAACAVSNRVSSDWTSD